MMRTIQLVIERRRGGVRPLMSRKTALANSKAGDSRHVPMSRWFRAIVGLAAASLFASNASAGMILYHQDFENPAGFLNNGGDISQDSVNTLYANQPPGFTFAQAHTVETLLITGTRAFGTGYSDPAGTGGNYALGMLSTVEDDLLGLSFNVGNHAFLNFGLDISSIDLSVSGGPFVPVGAVPVFEFTLYDNPTGVPGLGSGTVLDTLQASGTASPRDVFDWTAVVLPLDASGATNGHVIVRIDLLAGGYAALDNFRIVASDTPGDVAVPSVPEPSSLVLLGMGAVGLLCSRRRRRGGGVVDRDRSAVKPVRS